MATRHCHPATILCVYLDHCRHSAASCVLTLTNAHPKVVRASRDGGKTGSILIGRIPLMLRSDRCVLRGKTEEELYRYGALASRADV